MPKLTLEFELDDHLAERLLKTGLLDNPAQWFQARTTYSDTVAGYLRFIKHEIASDLSSMLGYASLLRRIETTPQQQKMFLAAIERSSRSFHKIVNDLTEVEIFEAEGARFKLAPTEFHAVLQEAIEMVQPLAEERQQTIVISTGSIPALMSTNYHLARLLEILLTNAILYTPESGKIEIFAEQNQHVAHIRIVDNGFGMAEDECARAFEKFFRSQTDEIQEQAGLGIGLTIARHIVNGHKGEIWLESTLNRGTTAHLILPLS